MIENDNIPVNTPLLVGNELKYISEAIESSWVSSEGPFVEKFERTIAQKVAREHGIAVSSGTAALDVAVAALKIEEGDEVIVPTHTIISCVLQVVRSGAIPVFVDSDQLTWNMDVTQIEDKITHRTKAIMAVHLYGLPADMDEILALATKYGLFVIEDASQVLGQTYRGKPCGSFGDISTTSFYPNKFITTGEGGMCLTNNSELAIRCQRLRNLCFKPGKRFVHEELGWNYRMTNLQAAIGVAQVERLDEHVKRKRAIGDKYGELLGTRTCLQLPLTNTDYAENIFWVFGVVLPKDIKLDNEYTMRELAKRGIGSRPFFFPLHQQPVFTQLGMFKNEKYPVAEHLSQKGFYVPCGIGITDEEISRCSVELIKVLDKMVI
jgi:perosamine synthetase